MKTTTQHTPGPWTIGRGYSSTNATPIRVNGGNLAWVCGLDSEWQFTKEQTAANARLIAAAPDLLDACEESVEAARLAGIHQDPDGADLPWYVRACAAIAKAQGTE